MSATRRRVLTGAAVGGGLLVAWRFWPRRWPDPLQLAEGEQGFAGWLRIGPDSVVTLAVPQLEMGQGVTTLLAQVAATELGADWRQMAVEMAPPAQLYANLPLAARWAPLWSEDFEEPAREGERAVGEFAREQAFCVTADGTSLAAYEQPIREAAASARAMLAMAAAEKWDVAPEQCAVEAGLVTYGPKRARFGELAAAAAAFDAPDPPPLRPEPARERPLAGDDDPSTSLPRLDLPAKVDGSLTFAGDIRLPGMVHASIRHAPWGDYRLKRFDKAAASGLRGLVAVVESERWIAAAAESWWTAEQALKRLAPTFEGLRGGDSGALDTALAAALDGDDGTEVLARGDAAGRLERPTLTARYRVAAAAQAPLETASATARLEGSRLELWIAAQAPGQARAAAAKAVGLSPGDVVLYPLAAGGSFDARLEARHAIEVAQLAKELGRPVQLTWPRANEFQAVPPRAPVMAELSAAFIPGSGGQIDAWRARIAAPAAMREFGARLFGNRTGRAALADSAGMPDAYMCEGADPPYGIGHVAVEHCPVETVLPSGRMRGNAPAYTAFFTECFLDELAEKAGRDPFLYRMELLAHAPRMAEVLRSATRLGGWNGGVRGSGQGLAMARLGGIDDGGRIACVAEASLSGGRVTVKKLSVAVDIGRIVNLDLARQQIEGGLVFGMGCAMGGAIRFEGGKPVERRLRELALPLLADCPEIVVDFLASDTAPCDPGELGVIVAAPAIANALHAATGTRYRSLPLLSGPA